jgi:hypothetical protein
MGEVGRGSTFDPLPTSPKIKNNFGGGDKKHPAKTDDEITLFRFTLKY